MTTISALTNGFETERITARQFLAEDREGLRPTLLNPDFASAFGRSFSDEAFADSAVQNWGGSSFVLTLIERDQGRTAGFASVYPAFFVPPGGALGAQLEVALDPAFHHQGLASEVMPALFKWAFDELVYPQGQSLFKLVAVCRSSNLASINLMLGLVRFGVRDLGEQEELLLPSDPAFGNAQAVASRVRIFEVSRDEFRQSAAADPPDEVVL